ncbi:flagellar motor protein MotB [Sulfitobacter aestuarii]|uniref:Flagellar motor protein MotB n=1 Tax=Sulfitobacter aestuarii TaxID=2161676 RepID=A0ABW5U293_9RHOB
MAKNNHVIIIKRPKKVSKGHHGGNWKVAYADFMTALMAFFLLLWILSVSDEDKLEGLAEYFTPATVSLVDTSGHDTIIDPMRHQNGEDSEAADISIGEGAPGSDMGRSAEPEGENPAAPGASENPWSALKTAFDAPPTPVVEQVSAEPVDLPDRLAAAEEKLASVFEDEEALAHLAENVMIARTDDGLVINIVDIGDRPMFRLGSADLTDDIRTILGSVAPAIRDVPLQIAITGHTDATPFRDDEDYGNWELSADRANATRRALVALGLSGARFVSVAGAAAMTPLLPDKPTDARNRRVTITLEAASS